MAVVKPIEGVITKWPASLSDRIAAGRAARDGAAEAGDTEDIARRYKGACRTG